MNNLKEPVFGNDAFRKPRVLNGWEAVVHSVLVILFGKPGFYPSIPELGMNIQQYRYARVDDIDTESLKVQLAYQFAKAQTGISDGSINVIKTSVKGNPVLAFKIAIDSDAVANNVLIGVKFDGDNISYNYQLMDAVLND